MVRTLAPLAAALLAAGLVDAQAPPKKQKMEAPKWLSDDGKDLFNDIESDENPHSEAACENREKLLKFMAGKGEQDASAIRSRCLLGLGLCEVKKENWAVAKKRLDSAISEMNVPSEDFMLKNPNLAPIALTKQASDLMKKYEVTQAGTQLRRCREVLERNTKSVLKQVHGQMSQQQGGQVPPLDKFIEEIPGLGKTGQFLPMLMDQVPMLRESFAFISVVENALDALDKKVAGIDPSQKSKKQRLDVSKGKGKTGSLLYARALFTEPVVPAERLAAAQELVESGVAKALAEVTSSADKSVTLLKRTKPGKGCEGDLATVCAKLGEIADIASNGFGETRLMVLKEGKKQAMEVCTTNANVGILMAAKDGATLTVSGHDEPVPLKAGEPVVYDYCLEASLESGGKVPVLFAQAWHPEFAAVERTTELRSRAKSFDLAEDLVKSVTKVVNDHAKKAWEKGAKLWRATSTGLESLRQSLQDADQQKAKAKEESDEAQRKADEDSDEERKKNLEELEKKRAEKRKKDEEAEAKRLARKKQLEEEKAKRDPWLNAPEVKKAEGKLEELKEARRDANAKLEFDLSTSITKDIARAERELKSAIKKAKKAHKKGGASAGEASKQEAKEEEKKEEKKASGSSAEAAELKTKLEDVKKRKAAASEAENFKEAKKLKAEQKELEEKLKKLEL